ncbi:hypothetical protein [Sandaracinobacteroides saxicola]|uniref:Uncharacterized protein n=1 Tax=Sandaracinobacteroides saxicola TaxID=2759707 RepID=A0A7G5IK26_9SPHN|nr:hypothetical protein [Sandaracinobacteroides saxicola]QMW23718.1 hypothetical protein H3309_04310 [Sandaracinobacteroides saxicola]
MTWNEILFAAVLFPICFYAVWKGSAPERLAVVTILAASFLTPFTDRAGFDRVEKGILLIDMGVMVSFGGIAFTANRFWPLYATAFQSESVLIHALHISPVPNPLVYADSIAIWAYPVLVALALGTWRESRKTPWLIFP